MDYSQYNKLTPDQKSQIWARLNSNPDFQILKELWHSESRIIAAPNSVDNEKKFIYESIRSQAIRDVIDYPSDFLENRI